jgi:inner membrane protein
VDNLTHTLTAIAISQAGINRKTRYATATLILAGNIPDIDIVAGFGGGIDYLKYHRGITHSLVGIVALAFLCWGIFYWLGKHTKPKSDLPLNSRWLLLAALLGTGSHLLLDFTNSYGVRPFLPFSGRWYAWDIMYVIDPLLLALLILGLGIPWILRLASEELGAARGRVAWGAIFSLGALLILWGVRDLAHRRALEVFDGRNYSGEAPRRVSAFPEMGNPFTWIGVIETDSSFHVVGADELDAGREPEEFQTFPKPQPSDALRAAMSTRAGKIMLDFSRYPWAEVETSDDGEQVSICDLRFYNPAARSRGFILEMNFDPQLRLRSQIFRFATPRK